MIADVHGPRGHYLEEGFCTDVGQGERTVESCLCDIERSKKRHILRFKTDDATRSGFDDLPIWSAAEAWSFGTLSKCIERGAQGSLNDAVATSVELARADLPTASEPSFTFATAAPTTAGSGTTQ